MSISRRAFARHLTASLGLGVAGPLRSATGPKGSVIKKFEVIPAAVEYRSTFRIGRGLVGGKGAAGKHVFLRLESADGHVGWGATNTVPNWSYETLESVVGTLEHYLCPLALNRTPFELNAIKKLMDQNITNAVSNGAPFAKSALEIALLDLAGQVSGQPLDRMLGGRVREVIELCFALSVDEPQAMAAEARKFPACRCFKVKVAGDADKDLKRLRAVSDARPDAQLWVDANQSYAPIALERFLEGLRQFPMVRCVEQPVRSEDWFGMKRAREKSPYPIDIDEGCFSAFDVARMTRLEAADLVVLKVPKSAGVTNCLKSAIVAEANGLGLLGSGLTDAGVSFMAAIHLYSTLDLLLPAELNGPQFLADMMVEGIEMDGVTVKVPDRPGLGITVSEDKVRAARIRLG
ncbi:MAG: muconate cycloisomerase [Acidobacteria bacterium]|nr:muconate cycloisomerase [Acidobacteriota bacterium]